MKISYLFSFVSLLTLGLISPSNSLHGSNLEFYSQASQDEFVYTILYDLLNKQDEGTYLEIGASDPIYINNTYFFEKNLGWTGVSVDASNEFAQQWKAARSNPLLIKNAMHPIYGSILKSFPKVIDYLTIDIDCDYDQVLKVIPFKDYKFKIITIEHDFYRYGDIFRARERKILKSFGYHLLCADVSFEGCKYEDWWIHPSVFPQPLFAAITALNLNSRDAQEIVQIIKAKLCTGAKK